MSPLGKFIKSLGEKYAQQVGYAIFQRLLQGIFRNINEEVIEKVLGDVPAKYVSKAIKKLVQAAGKAGAGGLGLPGLTDPIPEPSGEDEASAVAVPRAPPGSTPRIPPAGDIINSAPLVGEP
jgi:hypothetical protein